MSHSLTLELPDAIYERIQRTAQAMKQPVEQASVRLIELGLSPLDAPEEFDEELKALEALDDETLWEIFKSSVSPAIQRQLHRLLDKNQSGTLTEQEHRQLETLQREADRVMLCKAHAAVLLRWRGHRIPPLKTLRKHDKRQ